MSGPTVETKQSLRRSLGIVGMGKGRQRLRIERALVLRRCNAHSGSSRAIARFEAGVRIDSTSLGSHVGSKKYAIRYESFPNENFARGLRATPPFWSQSPSRRTGRRASSAKRFERAPRPASGARVATANVRMRQVLSDQHVANVLPVDGQITTGAPEVACARALGTGSARAIHDLQIDC